MFYFDLIHFNSEYMENNHPEILQDIVDKKVLTEENIKALETAITDFLGQYHIEEN